MQSNIRWATALLLIAGTAALRAQANTRLDVGVSFIAAHSLRAKTDETFWAEGGSFELGADALHGLGVAARISGVHTGSVGSAGVPLSLVTATFGPRYRWHSGHRLSVYGEALLGEADGFSSLFPSTAETNSSASSLALQVGGGADIRFAHHFALRPIEGSWLRTQLPNGTNNRQNSLQLGAGVVVRFGR